MKQYAFITTEHPNKIFVPHTFFLSQNNCRQHYNTKCDWSRVWWVTDWSIVSDTDSDWNCHHQRTWLVFCLASRVVVLHTLPVTWDLLLWANICTVIMCSGYNNGGFHGISWCNVFVWHFLILLEYTGCSVAVRYKKSISIIETVISIDYRYIDFLASYFSDRSRGIDRVGDNWRTVNTSANPHISDQLTELRTEYTC